MRDGRSKRKIELERRFCIICGNEIIRNTVANSKRISPEQYKKSKFCSRKCRGIFQSSAISGKENPNYRGGKSVCADCGKQLKYRYNFRKEITYCKNCWPKHYRQENAYKWKGGLTEINLLERNRKEAIEWRKSVFERDDYACQLCGDNKGHNLNAHHIKHWAKYKELRFDINNGITLCKNCHIKIHKK